jgi:hypothetical protein
LHPSSTQQGDVTEHNAFAEMAPPPAASAAAAAASDASNTISRSVLQGNVIEHFERVLLFCEGDERKTAALRCSLRQSHGSLWN